MRNVIYVAVFTALGYTMVSCDTDRAEALTTTSAPSKLKIESPVHDTMSRTDSLTVTTQTAPGPGDDVV